MRVLVSVGLVVIGALVLAAGLLWQAQAAALVLVGVVIAGAGFLYGLAGARPPATPDAHAAHPGAPDAPPRASPPAQPRPSEPPGPGPAEERRGPAA
jgi:hypothetical protein